MVNLEALREMPVIKEVNQADNMLKAQGSQVCEEYNER